jgi:DivIVA domain-containing protein
MLSPADIDSKQFGTTRLKEGYDQDEVDAFLDNLQKDYAFLQQTVAKLDDENATLRRIVEASKEAPTATLEVRKDPPSFVAEKLLEVAAEAARQVEEEAQAKAEETVREAGGRGARIIEEATEAAERIKSEALAEKYRRVEELEKQAARLESDISDLNYRGAEVRRALGAAIAANDKEVSQ